MASYFLGITLLIAIGAAPAFGRDAVTADGINAMVGQADEASERALEHYAGARQRAARRVERMARPLRLFGCRGLFLQFGFAQRWFERKFPLAAAHFIVEGRCFDRDPGRALGLIERYLGGHPNDGEALALMGMLYDQGIGVATDKLRANSYFKKASLKALWWTLDMDSPSAPRAGTYLADFWNLPIDEYWLSFINPVTGPWELPAPLLANVAWVRSLRHDGPDRLMKVAFTLREGTCGLPRSPQLAFMLLKTIVYHYHHIPAFYPVAIWIRDPDLTREREALGDLEDRKSELRTANMWLIEAARADDRRASPVIYRLLLQTPDYDRRDWAMYYWLKRMRRDGYVVDDAAITAAARALGPTDREMVDGWGVHELPPFTWLNRALPSAR